MSNKRRILEEEKHPGRLLLLLLATIVAVFAVYQVFIIYFQQFWLYVAYYVIAALIAMAYIAYNFGLTRQNVTPDMLPLDWTAEEKAAYMKETQERKKKSRFLLIILFAFIFTIAYDLAILFMPNLFGGLQEGINSWFS